MQKFNVHRGLVSIDPFRKHCLENALGDIELTLQHADKIRRFEGVRLARMPWLGNIRLHQSSS